MNIPPENELVLVSFAIFFVVVAFLSLAIALEWIKQRRERKRDE